MNVARRSEPLLLAVCSSRATVSCRACRRAIARPSVGGARGTVGRPWTPPNGSRRLSRPARRAIAARRRRVLHRGARAPRPRHRRRCARVSTSSRPRCADATFDGLRSLPLRDAGVPRQRRRLRRSRELVSRLPCSTGASASRSRSSVVDDGSRPSRRCRWCTASACPATSSCRTPARRRHVVRSVPRRCAARPRRLPRVFRALHGTLAQFIARALAPTPPHRDRGAHAHQPRARPAGDRPRATSDGCASCTLRLPELLRAERATAARRVASITRARWN